MQERVTERVLVSSQTLSADSSSLLPAFRLPRRVFLAMLDWTRCPAAERVPGKVSYAWVFKATRVPVRALFENLEDGAMVNEFLT